MAGIRISLSSAHRAIREGDDCLATSIRRAARPREGASVPPAPSEAIGRVHDQRVEGHHGHHQGRHQHRREHPERRVARGGKSAVRPTLGRGGGCRAHRGCARGARTITLGVWRFRAGRLMLAPSAAPCVRLRAGGRTGRGLRAISSSVGRCGFLVRIVNRSSSRTPRLAIRSSSEWYARTTTRPPGARSSTARGREAANSSISRLTANGAPGRCDARGGGPPAASLARPR